MGIMQKRGVIIANCPDGFGSFFSTLLLMNLSAANAVTFISTEQDASKC
jgi:hypothetical protein